MLKVVLTERADAVLEEIIQFYLTEYSETRAGKVIQSIDEAFDKIGKSPYHFPKCFNVTEPKDNIRQIIVHSTFKIIFRIQSDKIEILEIFHGNRDSDLLKDIK